MPSLPTLRARAGARAKAAGGAWEGFVEGQNEMAIRLGLLACVEHTRPPMIVRGGKAIYTAASVADYIGTLAAGTFLVDPQHLLDRRVGSGLSLALEAKSCADARFYRQHISPGQQAHLAAVSRAGGLALLLVEFREEKAALWTIRRFAGRWDALPWERARTAETLTAAGMAAAGCELAGGCYLAKFMDTARAGV